MNASRVTLAAACVAALIGIAGCGSSAGSAAPSTGPSTQTSGTPAPSGGGGSSTSAAATTVIIKNFAYQGPSSVKPGATVSVTNQDSTAHTVTSDMSGQFDVTVAPGATETFKAPSKPGSYAYHCNFHAEMHGVLVVK